jgi:hypothetical protein
MFCTNLCWAVLRSSAVLSAVTRVENAQSVSMALGDTRKAQFRHYGFCELVFWLQMTSIDCYMQSTDFSLLFNLHFIIVG